MLLCLVGRTHVGIPEKSDAHLPYLLPLVGAALPEADRVAYVIEQAVEQPKEIRQLILIGARALGAFCLSGERLYFTSLECDIHTLTSTNED
jgi:hypothetical protein